MVVLVLLDVRRVVPCPDVQEVEWEGGLEGKACKKGRCSVKTMVGRRGKEVWETWRVIPLRGILALRS